MRLCCVACAGEFRQYEMLVPLAALQPGPRLPEAINSQTQRCIWRAGLSGSHSSCWERRESGQLALTTAPAEIHISGTSKGYYFEWTQSRKHLGTLPPMIRLAICVLVPANVVAESQGKDRVRQVEQDEEQWFVSAVGDRKCHAYGAALEYFSCTAVNSPDPTRPNEGCVELHTTGLDDMLWRPLELHTLHVLKQPAKPQKLPFVLEKNGATKSSIELRRVGFWCDASEPPSEDTDKQEVCSTGSQLHKPSAARLSGSALAAARTATLQELLTPTELFEVKALIGPPALGDCSSASTEESSTATDGAVVLDPESRPGGLKLTKKDRTRLYDAINGLDPALRCTLIDEVGQTRVIKVWRDAQMKEPVSESRSPADDGAAPCRVLDAVDFGLLQLVQLADGESRLSTTLRKDEDGKNPGGLLDDVAMIQASATTSCLNGLLGLFEGKAGHSFHNFSASLTASQRKCRRQVARATCSGSFLLLRKDDDGGCTSQYPVEQCWAVLTVCSSGFLYRQIQHMIGCGTPTLLGTFSIICRSVRAHVHVLGTCLTVCCDCRRMFVCRCACA